MVRHLIAGALLLAIAAAPATAQLVPIGREQRADTRATAGYCPDVTRNGGGGFTVAWSNVQDEGQFSCGPAGRLYGRTYDRDGAAAAPPFLAARAGNQCVYDVRVGTAAGEEPLFTWSQVAGKYGVNSIAVARAGSPVHALQQRSWLAPLRSGDFVALIRVFGANRANLVVERRHDPEEEGRRFVAAEVDGNIFSADAVELPDGGLIIVWIQESARRPAATTVQGRRFDADGAPRGPAFLISGADLVSGARDVMMAANEAGQFVVTWTSIDAPVSTSYAMARAYGSEEQPASPVLRVSPRVQGTQELNRPAIDEQGNFVVLWSHSLRQGEARLFARMFDAQGRRLGPQLRLAGWSSTASVCAGVASLEDGRWVAAWGRFPYQGPVSGISLQRFTSD